MKDMIKALGLLGVILVSVVSGFTVTGLIIWALIKFITTQ